MPAHGIHEYARFASTWVAWYLATASVHSLPAIPAWDLTLIRCTGFGELRIICMSSFKISPCTRRWWSLGYNKCFLIWWRDERLSVAICEWLWRMGAVIAASSALLIVFVMPIPFGSTKLRVEVAGWYEPAPVTYFPLWIWQLPSVHAHSFQSETFWLSLGWILLGRAILNCGWEYVCVGNQVENFSNLFQTVGGEHWELGHYWCISAPSLLLEYHRPGPLPSWDFDYSDAIVLLYSNSNYLHTPFVARG